MSRQREYNPLGDLLGVQKRLNEMFESAMAQSNFDTPSEPAGWTPVADAYESSEGLTLILELPGVDADGISLRIDDDELVVEGELEPEAAHRGDRHHRLERSYGKFSRRFRVPPGTDREAIEATYRLGELRVRVPRKSGAGRGTIQVPIR